MRFKHKCGATAQHAQRVGFAGVKHNRAHALDATERRLQSAAENRVARVVGKSPKFALFGTFRSAKRWDYLPLFESLSSLIGLLSPPSSTPPVQAAKKQPAASTGAQAL